MKIEAKHTDTKFNPIEITITIETIEEFLLLKHLKDIKTLSADRLNFFESISDKLINTINN